ncbi:hypothetical protein [Novosphingobium sp. FKTRR1]|uniref:hypothetical protein n=1 Tax=Novosphingobium sp. FKTRR1 TaxID=2879118 RepID=UPI001CEFDAAF|nr:hypothetical protein [Novosphingobium sp. FKTRR1]
MTVAAITPLAQYIEDGTTMTFSAPFRYLDTADLIVTRIVHDTATLLVLGTDYTATAGPTDAGGNVTLSTTVPDAKLRIGRKTARRQQSDFENTVRFPAATVEVAYDRNILIAQEQDVQLRAALQVPAGETAPPVGSLSGAIDGTVLGFVSGQLVPVANTSAASAQAVADAEAARDLSLAYSGSSLAQAYISTTQAELSAASASSSATSASQSQLYAAAAQAIMSGRFFANTTDPLTNGVLGLAMTANGSTGTNGTFTGTFTGGGGAGAQFRFVVAANAVVPASIVITNKGSGYTSTPTPVFSASTGLAGTAATVTTGPLTTSGDYLVVEGSGGTFAALYKNVAGVIQSEGLSFPSKAALDNAIASLFYAAPAVTVNGRKVQPTVMSYDRYVSEGIYLDTMAQYRPLELDPTNAVALAKNYYNVPPITFGGRQLQPIAMSFDRYVTLGTYSDTGEIYAPGISGGATDRSLMQVNQTPTGFSIFIAGAVTRWTEYVFLHETGTASGGAYDVWHLKGAWDTALTGFAPSRQQQLLRSDAEVETAVWATAAGASNFVGGAVHGAQVLSSAVMLVDGKVTSLNQTASYTARRIEVFQQSVLYAYGSGNSVKLLDLYTRWVFEGGDIRIGFAVQWPASPAQVQQTYFGILPVFRTQGSGPSGAGSAVEIVTTGRRSPLFLPEDLSTSGYTEVDTTAEEMIGYGAGGYEFRLRKTRGWTYSGRLSYYAPTVQNKFYQNVYGPNYTPVANQLDWFESVISIYNPY